MKSTIQISALIVVAATILFFALKGIGLIGRQEPIVVVKKVPVVVTKVDTVVKKMIQVKKIVVPKLVKDTVRDTVYVLPDSSFYSTAEFETKFEKIRIGAYAKSPVDSFTFVNYPKPVIISDTVFYKEKNRLNIKGGLLWGLIGISVGVILAK